MLDHRQTYSPIRKTRVDLIAANLFNRIKKGLRWRSQIPGVCDMVFALRKTGGLAF